MPKAFPKATSKRLGDNLEKAGKPKPTPTSQAHHDLPKKHQDKFNNAGLDIDAAEYGRWVEGARPGVKNVGTHQNWNKSYEKEWDAFFANNKKPSKEQILDFMKDLRKRFPPPPQ